MLYLSQEVCDMLVEGLKKGHVRAGFDSALNPLG
jgi:hypothetical protein